MQRYGLPNGNMGDVTGPAAMAAGSSHIRGGVTPYAGMEGTSWCAVGVPQRPFVASCPVGREGCYNSLG